MNIHRMNLFKVTSTTSSKSQPLFISVLQEPAFSESKLHWRRRDKTLTLFWKCTHLSHNHIFGSGCRHCMLQLFPWWLWCAVLNLTEAIDLRKETWPMPHLSILLSHCFVITVVRGGSNLHQTWVQITSLTLNCYVTLYKCPNFSGYQFSSSG